MTKLPPLNINAKPPGNISTQCYMTGQLTAWRQSDTVDSGSEHTEPEIGREITYCQTE